VVIFDKEMDTMTKNSVDMRLDGQVAIVTGGGTGIGEATAKLFARQGAKVVVANRRASLGNQVVEQIRSEKGQAIFVGTDVSDAGQVRALVEKTIQTFGRVDILFNNAGVGASAPFWEMSEEDWNRMIGVDLTGHFLCAKYVVPHMLKQGRGAIVNMSSVLGFSTFANQVAYTTCKSGIIGMTKAMALDLASKDIRVNCIVPGSIDTPMMWESYPPEDLPRVRVEAARSIPMGRVAPPEEIASAVLFLVSPAASLITGTTLIADGGLLCKIATDY
jgi:NAD(P)-dependent dehydrogenase (short-subunit alcohol dehydrogenase family)